MSHDFHKAGKLEGDKVLTIGSRIAILRPRLSHKQRR
jgi:hypothetical protein